MLPPTINRIIVTGSTTWTNAPLLTSTLQRYSAQARDTGASFRLLTGTARGADTLALQWAKARGINVFAEDLDPGEYPGPMHRYNAQLLSLQPDLVLAFKEPFHDDWHHPACVLGTEHMCRIAAEANVPVLLNGERWLTAASATRPAPPEPVTSTLPSGVTLEARVADITQLQVDVIVNAANASLLGGGGVDRAIHLAAGPDLLEECRTHVAAHGPTKTGDCVLTGAGDLPARWVVHTVGPIWSGKDPETQTEELSQCYRGSLRLAYDAQAESIAFPCISTGVYRFPKPLAAKTAVAAVREFFKDSTQSSIRRVTFAAFNESDLEHYTPLLRD